MGLTIKKSPIDGAKNYTDHLQATPAVGEVTVSKKVQGSADYALVQDKVEALSAPQVLKKDDACTITVRCGKTVNLGNYESARVDISLAVPASKSELEDSYKFAVDWVEAKMAEALEGVK